MHAVFAYNFISSPYVWSLGLVKLKAFLESYNSLQITKIHTKKRGSICKLKAYCITFETPLSLKFVMNFPSNEECSRFSLHYHHFIKNIQMQPYTQQKTCCRFLWTLTEFVNSFTKSIILWKSCKTGQPIAMDFYKGYKFAWYDLTVKIRKTFQINSFPSILRANSTINSLKINAFKFLLSRCKRNQSPSWAFLTTISM
jgi:hypothetical protein